MPPDRLQLLEDEITACRSCPRLVEWREAAGVNPPARFARADYWARPVPGFGDPGARIVVVGLAPAANGANRTGRMFTGDRSGDFLYSSMYRCGLATQPSSTSRDDGLALRGAWVTSVNRCAPPANKPTPEERDRCIPFLVRELAELSEARVMVALGAFAWDGALRVLRSSGLGVPTPKPRFGHGVEVEVGGFSMIGAFHPSQQNTFTGKLTESMLDDVFARAVEMADFDLNEIPS